MAEESKRANILIPCDCGKCDLQILKYDEHNGWQERKYAKGHALKGKPHSEEHKQRITEAKIGHKVLEYTKQKISKTLTGRSISEEHKQNIGKSKTGHKNAMWKGGKYLDSYGYYKVWAPTHPFKDYWGYVFEHRLVMEKHIGRYLSRDELVHHINEIKTDNRIENLQIMTRIEHSKYHWKKERNLLVPIIRDLCR